MSRRYAATLRVSAERRRDEEVSPERQGLVTTDAAEADGNQLPELIPGRERELSGDRAYWNEAD